MRKKEEFKECDIYIGKEFYSQIERDSRALSISINSLISWMLFRGCIDLQRNVASVNKDSDTSSGKDDNKMKEWQRVHCRISDKVHMCLKELCEKRYHTELKNLLPKVIKMEYDRMNKYDMIRKPKAVTKKSCKKIRLRVNMEVADKEEVSNLLNKIISGEEKLEKEINIKVNSEFLNQLNNISVFTGIKLSDLIPLMLCEYLMILSKARYKLPEGY